MEKSIIATGKTLDLAIDAALRQLGLDRDSVSVEIIENAKTGFLGIGAAPAKVKVTYEAPDEGPSPALSAASRTRIQKVDADAPVPAAPAPKTAAPKRDTPERRPAPRREPTERREPPRESKPAQRSEPRPAAPKAAPYTAPLPGSTEEQVEVFIKGLLEHMGSSAVPQAVKTAEDTYLVDLVGDDLGMLIGRRGETLDAIQHLTNYTVNRDAGKRSRISVDAEHYRQKREESLQRLAFKVAGKVTKYRRNITLEPMNAYERHVIHAALQDLPDVSTFSTGTEPNRRIVVSYSRGKASSDNAE